jgi:hypothetical protein
MPHGQEKRWYQEAGVRGFMGWQEWKHGKDLENYVIRLASQQNKAFFAGLSSDAKSGIFQVLRGTDIVGGRLRHGGIARAGQLGIPRNRRQLREILEFFEFDPKDIDSIVRGPGKSHKLFGRHVKPGMVDSSGRVLGNPLDDSPNMQFYRVITRDQAEATYKKLLKDHPEAKKVLHSLLDEAKETPVITRQGTFLPGFSRKRLQRKHKIKGAFGRDSEEAQYASALIKQAFGPDAFPEDQLWQFNWVPEVPISSTGLLPRFRNGLAGFRSRSRLGKTGRSFERELATGETPDLEKAMLRNRTDLAREDIRNNMAKSVMSTVAEPLSPEDIRILEKSGGVGRLPGYQVVGPTGMFGQSAALRGVMRRNKEWFQKNGIDVPDVIDATYLAGGKGYKVPDKIAEDIGAFFQDKPRFTDPVRQARVEAWDKAIAGIIAIPQITWLSRPSTANRNFFSQVVTFAPKAIKDTYTWMFQQIPALRYESLPSSNLMADFSALGRMHSKRTRGLYPPEMMGSTHMSELQGGSRMRQALSKPLSLFGFNYHDVSFKRLLRESVIDAKSREAWEEAKRFGLTKGKTRDEFIRHYRAGVPKEVWAWSMREADTWGAFDYDNVGPIISKLKRTAIGRSSVPYPTYMYKLIANLYTEIGWTPQGYHRNWWALTQPGHTKAQRVNALANLATGATLAAIAWNVTDDVGNMAAEIEDDEIRDLANFAQNITGRKLREADLPFQFQQFGRANLTPGYAKELLGMEESNSLWVRHVDIPIFGEVAAAKAIMGGDYDVGQFLNDRLAIGPLVTGVSIMGDMADKYNKNHTRASRAGKLLADITPFTNEFKFMRKMMDDEKRHISRLGAPAWEDVLAGFADNFPVLSSFLAEDTEIGREFEGDKFGILRQRVSVSGLAVPKYDKKETLGAHFLLNMRTINQEEREAAIGLMAIQLMSDYNADLREEILLEHVLKVMNAETGETAIGEAKKKVKASDPVVRTQLQKTRNAIMIRRAFIAALPGKRMEAALEAAHNWTADAKDVAVIKSARRILIGLNSMDTDISDYILRQQSRQERGQMLRFLQEEEEGE